MQKNAERQYLTRFVAAMTVYTILLVAAVLLIRLTSSVALKTLLAVLPALPLAAGLRAYLRYLENIDELQKLIQLQAISLAAGVTIMVTFVYGLLESLAGFPHISLLWVLPLLVMVWGLGTAYYSRRYQ